MESQARGDGILGVTPAASRRFGLNLTSNVGRLGLSLLIGVWYVPFLVRHLGPASYGLVPLASTITSYMALITLGLNSAVGRYLTIALEQGDNHKASQIFNTSFWGSIILTAILLVPAALGVLYLNDIIRIPEGEEVKARWLFAATIAAFLLNEINTPLAVSSFCRNRFDLRNIVAICEVLARVGLVVLLFYAVAPAIHYVGFAIFFGTVVSSIGAVWLWRKLTPSLHLHPRFFDWKILRELTHTGGWVIVNQIGSFLYLSIDLIVANRLFGPIEGGRYAAVLQLPTLCRSLGVTIGEIFVPTLFQKYAQNDFGGAAVYLNQGIKYLGLVMALAIGLICGFAKPLLELWLGPGFGALSSLLFLMAFHQSINLSVHPLYAVPLAGNWVKVPGIITLAGGVLNLLLALILAGVLGWGLYGIAAAGAICLTLRHLVFTPLYAAIVLRQPYRTFYRRAVPTILATFATIGLCRLILLTWTISTWVGLGLAATAVSLAYAATVYFLLSSEERKALKIAALYCGKWIYGGYVRRFL